MGDNSQRGRSHAARRSCVALGDSLINYGATVWSETSRQLDDRGWVNWTLAYLKQRMRLLNYYGSGGIYIEEMQEILEDDILTLPVLPGYLFTVSAGTNLLNGQLPSVVIPKIKEFYTTCQQAGIIVIDCTNGPSTAISTSTLRKNVFEVNHWKKHFVQENDGVFMVDANSLIVDGTSATGAPATGMTVDGTHYTSAGAQRIGLAAFNILDKVIPYHDCLISSKNDLASLGAYGNLLTNPTFDGTSGANSGTGASGNVADSWTHVVSGTVTSAATKVARSGDNIGAWQRLAVSSAGSLATASMFQEVTTNITVGHEIYGNVEINTQTAFTEISSVQLEVACRDGSGDLATTKAMTFNDGTVDAVGNIVLQTHKLKVPSGTTSIYFTVKIQVDSGASAGAATVDIGRAQLRRLYSPS